jgi:amidohydrolase
VRLGAYDLETAFVAESGSGPFVVAVCAEYDALPDIGHACGHNIIAAAAAGAGIGLARVADDVGVTVRVVGSPAEELGGGKALLLERGAFAGAHVAMMIHPWSSERLRGRCLAVAHFDVTYRGRESHASAAPWDGVNAADAMTVAQVAVGLLRQQLRPGDQVHGVVTQGGKAANIIPSLVTGRFMYRSPTIEALDVLAPRVRRCFEAGALASGAELEVTAIGPPYTHMVSDERLLALYRPNAEALGRRFDLDDEDVPLPTFSTDMSNVSLEVPTIHPLVAIDAGGAVNHQPDFAAACVTASADAAVYDGAVALAWTAIDAAASPEVGRQPASAGSS